MKKNWTMRVGVLMLALTLITSCFVGGTFAKYTTAGGATDSARVAKFGVTIDAKGTTFAKSYEADEADGYTGVTVESSNDKNVIAPGTSGEMVAVKLSGTPEVAVRIGYQATLDLSENWVDAGGAYYCPLEIKVNEETLLGKDFASVEAFETAVIEKINGYTKDCAPRTDLSAEGTADLKVSWSWAFEGNDDVKDTYLGDQAAADNAATVLLTVNTNVTQID